MNLVVKYLQNLWEIASGQAKNGLVCASVGFLFHRITIAIVFWVTPRARAVCAVRVNFQIELLYFV